MKRVKIDYSTLSKKEKILFWVRQALFLVILAAVGFFCIILLCADNSADDSSGSDSTADTVSSAVADTASASLYDAGTNSFRLALFSPDDSLGYYRFSPSSLTYYDTYDSYSNVIVISYDINNLGFYPDCLSPGDFYPDDDGGYYFVWYEVRSSFGTYENFLFYDDGFFLGSVINGAYFELYISGDCSLSYYDTDGSVITSDLASIFNSTDTYPSLRYFDIAFSCPSDTVFKYKASCYSSNDNTSVLFDCSELNMFYVNYLYNSADDGDYLTSSMYFTFGRPSSSYDLSYINVGSGYYLDDSHTDIFAVVECYRLTGVNAGLSCTTYLSVSSSWGSFPFYYFMLSPSLSTVSCSVGTRFSISCYSPIYSDTLTHFYLYQLFESSDYLCTIHFYLSYDTSDDFAAGYDDGYSIGSESGYDDGYDKGYSSGYSSGSSSGYSDGYAEGYDVGSSEGYTDGYADSYDEGYSYGYDDGSSDGYDSAYRNFYGYEYIEGDGSTISYDDTSAACYVSFTFYDFTVYYWLDDSLYDTETADLFTATFDSYVIDDDYNLFLFYNVSSLYEYFSFDALNYFLTLYDSPFITFSYVSQDGNYRSWDFILHLISVYNVDYASSSYDVSDPYSSYFYISGAGQLVIHVGGFYIEYPDENTTVYNFRDFYNYLSSGIGYYEWSFNSNASVGSSIRLAASYSRSKDTLSASYYYSLGYDIGYTDSWSSPVSKILSGVGSILEIEVFGVFSLGTLISIGVFLFLALAFIKLFATG